jgi:seryl-tRNA synthetase
MLDIRFIRENKDLVAAAAKKKHAAFDVEELIAADDKRKSLLSLSESKRAEQNAANAGIASAASESDRASLDRQDEESSRRISRRPTPSSRRP